MTTTTTLPLPDVNNALNAPFWAAARDHRLVLQKCGACNAVQWPPKTVCNTCLHETSGADWAEVEPRGTLWSYIVYHRAFHPGFKDLLPYNVAMVKLDAGTMFTTSIVGDGPIEIGQRVEAVYDAVTPEVTLVRFRATG